MSFLKWYVLIIKNQQIVDLLIFFKVNFHTDFLKIYVADPK